MGVLRVGEAVGVAAGFDDVAAEGESVHDRSAKRGSVRVFVQPENDEAAFESNPNGFLTKLVGLARLVTDPRAVLDSLDAQQWRTV